MILDATDLSMEISLGAAVATTEAQFVASWVDVTATAFTPGNTHGTTNGVNAVTVVAAPGASTQREMQELSVYNADTASITLSVKLNHNSADYRTVWAGSLYPGDEMVYTHEGGFSVISLGGGSLQRGTIDVSYEQECSRVTGFAQRILGQTLLGGRLISQVLTSDMAYWTYMGYTLKSFVAKYVEFLVKTAGAGAQTAEVALASSTNPPNKANQTLTKLVADGTVDSLTSTGVKRNTNTLAYTVAKGVHLWAGLRTAMAVTQPAVYGFTGEFQLGQVLTTAAAGALTGAGPWTGSIIAQSTTVDTCMGADLRVTLD